MLNKRLLAKLTDSRKYIVMTMLLNTGALLANVISIFAIARLLDALIRNTFTSTIVIQTAMVVLGVIVLRAIFNLLSARTSYLSSAKVKQNLREELYQKLLRLGANKSDQVSTSEAVQLAVEGIEQLETYFASYLPQLIYSLVAPFSLFVILSFINLKAAIVLLICVPLIPISIAAVQTFAQKLLEKYWGVYTNLGDSFLENIQGLTTLKIYEADVAKSDEMDMEAEKFRQITMRVLTMQLNSITIMDLIAYGGAALGVIISASEFAAGNIGFAGAFIIIIIIMLSAEFFIPLCMLGSFFHIAMNGMAASEKLFKILDIEEGVAGNELIESCDISFEKIQFSYDEDREILNNIDFKITDGEFVSFVGKSGSGKSTVAGLIMGLYGGYRGNIRISNKNLHDIAERSIMDNITMVSHNSYIFKGTVRENLLMGNPQASKNDMDGVLRKVNLYDFVYNERGLETEILEGGSNLSGGQRQRLALARAILHDTPIYIFDEVTSSVDIESETLIMEIIRELALTKTVILISHRLANVVNSDRICVLDQGRLVQKGKHDELMAQEGRYKEMFTKQRNLELHSNYDRGTQYV